MKTRLRIHFIHSFLLALVGSVPAESSSALYQITSGEYVTIGGFVGSWTNKLPNSTESFVEVTTDPATDTASVRILGADQTSASIALLNGTLQGNQIRFHYTTAHPDFPGITNQTTIDYTVSLAEGTLTLDGSRTSQPRCCDIPYAFLHNAVQAAQRPDLFTEPALASGLSVSTNSVFPGDALEVRWQGYNNRTYCIPEIACVERFGSAAGPWQDGVFLVTPSTNLLLGTATFSGALAVGGSYMNQGRFLVPTNTAPGLYGVEIRIDYREGNTNGNVPEQNEGNNAGRRSNVVTVRPRLAFTEIRRLDDHTVRLQVTGSLPQPVRIQVRQSLGGAVNGVWTDWTNSPGFRGVTEFQDAAATNKTRFYRALSP